MNFKKKYLFDLIILIYFVAFILNESYIGNNFDIINLFFGNNSSIINFALLLITTISHYIITFLAWEFNFIILAIYLIYKIYYVSFRKEKNPIIIFEENKNYYRDLISDYSPGVLSFLENFETEIPKDLVATLLKLENKKTIKLNDKIVKEEINKNGFDEAECFILDSIRDGVLYLNSGKYRNKVIKSAIRDELIIVDPVKTKKIKIKKIISILLYLILISLYTFCLLVLKNKEFMAEITKLLLIAPIFLFIYFIILKKSNIYIRTEKGENIHQKVLGLKSFLKDFSNINNEKKDGIKIWDDYFVYSIIFGQNNKIVREYDKWYVIYYIDAFDKNSAN